MDVATQPSKDDKHVVGDLRFDVIVERAGQILKKPAEGVTHEDLAELFGVSKRTITRWRNRSTSMFLSQGLDIARILDLPVDQFTWGER